MELPRITPSEQRLNTLRARFAAGLTASALLLSGCGAVEEIVDTGKTVPERIAGSECGNGGELDNPCPTDYEY